MCVCAQCQEFDPDGTGCTCDRFITCELCRDLEAQELDFGDEADGLEDPFRDHDEEELAP